MSTAVNTDVSTTHPLPLAGVRVLDFAHMMQGPWAAEMLGDLGADVIKVEVVGTGERGRQSGTTFLDGTSAQFLAMNRNKRSLAVDLKTAAGVRVAEALLATADVLIQNFRPGVMDRLGLGWERAHELNPRLVYCTASGYGADVPDPRKPGQDLLAQARTGALWLTGTGDDLPTPCGPFVADVHAATMLALGATAALLDRDRTGRGRLVEVDLVGAMLHQTVQEVVAAVNSGEPPRRSTAPGSAYIEAPYGVHATADGHIAISLTTMEALAAGLEAPEILERFPDKAAATAGRDELNALVAGLVATRPTQDVLDALDAAGVWCAPVNDHRQMTTDPYVRWEQRRLEVEHPVAGRVELVGNPITLDGQPLPARRSAPLLGEHTVELLMELGLDVDELLADGVVEAPADRRAGR
ncbi:CaiB/BaiF CoA transferase family protein [Jiangella gansuensis]|uniref:CaiB/BaiF CoA transferase family protein n=1 Tax=Jiangella gansuensis TaxID=281473 RepID=UPI0012F86AEF|nr:CoA transferase [Jiangella gansuensis]